MCSIFELRKLYIKVGAFDKEPCISNLNLQHVTMLPFLRSFINIPLRQSFGNTLSFLQSVSIALSRAKLYYCTKMAHLKHGLSGKQAHELSVAQTQATWPNDDR